MVEQVVTVAVTLPVNGTRLDIAQALVQAIYANHDVFTKTALSQLLSCVELPKPMQYEEGRTMLVFGRGN